MTAALWAAPFLALAGVTAYALSHAGRDQPVRHAVIRARWAWRCRWRWKCRGRPPVRDEGGEKLTVAEYQALGNLAAGRDVRART